MNSPGHQYSPHLISGYAAASASDMPTNSGSVVGAVIGSGEGVITAGSGVGAIYRL